MVTWLKRAVFILAALLAGPAARAASPSWTPLGPFGGDVSALTLNPSNPRELYATLVDHGVFKSTDGGTTWSSLPCGLATGNLAVDPSRPGTLYLATAEGVRKSTDGGAHWRLLALRAPAVRSVAVDPARPSRLYAATAGSGVFHSADSGSSWQPARVPLPAGDASQVTTLAVARPGGTVYAGTGAGVFKSLDGALSWQPTGGGLPEGYVVALAVAPADPRTVYASLDTAREVYRSTDGGASWRATGALASTNGAVSALAVSPASARMAWAGSGAGLFLTTDGGAHWTLSGPPPARPVGAIALAPSPARTIYAGLLARGFDLGGVLASTDGGVTWRRGNQGLTGLAAFSLTLPPGSPGAVWAGMGTHGLFRSANAGKRWTRVGLPDAGNGADSILDLELAPADPATSYALSLGQLWRTEDSGSSWSETFSIATNPELRFLRVDPTDPFRLWGSTGYGSIPMPLLRSADGGVTWNAAPAPDLGCAILDLQFAPSSPATLYVAGARSVAYGCFETRASLFRSTDGGATWAEADTGLNAFTVANLAVDPLDPRIVYAGTSGDGIPSDHGYGVWKSADGGVSWAPTGSALAGRTITALALSPAGVLWAAPQGGEVFRSDDGGATWKRWGSGLQGTWIYRLAIDPADPHHLYAATASGIWEIEDEP